MNAALLGYGTVGRSFYTLTQNCDQINIAWVLSLEKQAGISCRQTLDIGDILHDASVDLVVELIGGLHPAYEYISAALKAGKHVVTANKHLVCTYYRELIALAQQHHVSLRCTAAAGGGIPWLTSLARAAEVDQITDVWGIMNGTTNYILSAMAETGADYAQSLRDAQRLGFAEADPTADVEGYDAMRKIVLSANIGFGVCLDEASVPCMGISTITAKDIETFADYHYVCKLIAHAHQKNGLISVAVEPMLLNEHDRTAQISGADNIISLRGACIGEQSFTGAGAGGYPTASNVLADCVNVSKGCEAFYTDRCRAAAALNDQCAAQYYIRGAKQDEIPGAREMGEGYISQPMSVAFAHKLAKDLKLKYPGLFAAALMEAKDA